MKKKKKIQTTTPRINKPKNGNKKKRTWEGRVNSTKVWDFVGETHHNFPSKKNVYFLWLSGNDIHFLRNVLSDIACHHTTPSPCFYLLHIFPLIP
jgi:hypothetical protein